VVLLAQTRLSDAVRVADALRQFVAGKKIIRRDINQSLGTVTISVGVAQFQKGESLSQFLRRADSGVYKAKAEGRNRVVPVEYNEAEAAAAAEAQDRFSDIDSAGAPPPAVSDLEAVHTN
ncbi:MAG TPA: diguanylate cyclase, partial [Alphaproteobacteria bacterium]|nr:diguanylate cyclase [Alphaproteobacteria bacterium]